jgi:hypothetical protein
MAALAGPADPGRICAVETEDITANSGRLDGAQHRTSELIGSGHVVFSAAGFADFEASQPRVCTTKGPE